MNAPAAHPVTVPAPQYTHEQIKIAAYISMANAMAQIGHAMHLLTACPDSEPLNVKQLMQDAARAASNIISTTQKITSGE